MERKVKGNVREKVNKKFVDMARKQRVVHSEINKSLDVIYHYITFYSFTFLTICSLFALKL